MLTQRFKTSLFGALCSTVSYGLRGLNPRQINLLLMGGALAGQAPPSLWCEKTILVSSSDIKLDRIREQAHFKFLLDTRVFAFPLPVFFLSFLPSLHPGNQLLESLVDSSSSSSSQKSHLKPKKT